MDLSSLTSEERHQVLSIGLDFNEGLPLVKVWELMDEAWRKHGCSNIDVNCESYEKFYSDPVWLIYSLFAETDPITKGMREQIASYISGVCPNSILDYGGGYGSLARLVAAQYPNCRIDILEPYPFQSAVKACISYPNICFVSKSQRQGYDLVIAMDVFEHLADPLEHLSAVSKKINIGGLMIVGNCFSPIIQCHLPSTFHLRYTFGIFCLLLGLAYRGRIGSTHAHCYARVSPICTPLTLLRIIVPISRFYYLLRTIYTKKKLHRLAL